ncbi:nuclear pore complex protein Nup107-like [Oppia nitens]|uniref:nuclear pore complex protein Nup107-like n=1 Tax=Oppia nitens TaxID=1686743 RepID=UPI0023DA288D|nr:nuclear pore complex protein Nup107-like [Oppia nitens]
MDKSNHSSLYYNSLLLESPSIRDSTSRHANRFIQNSFAEMSSMHLLSSNLINQSVFLANETMEPNSRLDFDIKEDETQEDETITARSSLTVCQQFFETNQKYSIDVDNIFEMLTEFELLCCDHLVVTANMLKSKVRHLAESQDMNKLENVFRLERNSWRLIRAIFEDRLRSEDNSQDDMMVDDIVTKMSDKTLIERTFETNNQLRQMQLVIDWLEKNQLDDNEDVANDRIQFYSEGPYSWENTLHSLKTRDENYESGRQLCQRMDPDGPIRTRQSLHDLDVEDENRLYRYIFQLLRAGQLFDAKEVTQRLGYHWLSAALDGWLLYHDPNYINDKETRKVLEPIEGNANRDLWKYVCWRASKAEGTNIYERAIYAALTGNLAILLPLCPKWNDKLWAYFKSSLDVHIESELKNTLSVRPEAKPRFTIDLPDLYWDNQLNSNQIFREMETHGSLSSLVEETYHQNIQKFIILCDIDGLIDYMYECSKFVADMRPTKVETRSGRKSEKKELIVNPQLLRFFAHLVLTLRYLNVKTNREMLAVAIIEYYINYLIDNNQIQLVTYYTSKLPKNNQITTFARLLEGVEDEDDRKLCIALAKKAELDINSITVTVVDNVRTKLEELPSASELMNTTTTEDKKKINSLDWLLFQDVQEWTEAIKQSNTMMRNFLLSRKVDAMKDTFLKLPEDIIDNVYNQCIRRTGSNQLNTDNDNAIREYLCHKAYIQANDAFSDWLYCLHNSKPREPLKPVSKRFADTVAYEQSLKQYESDLNYWKEMLKKQGKLTAEKIEHVLHFPDGGWMADQRHDGSKDELRLNQMEELRKQYIPQLVFIAHSIHKSSNNLSECLKLADLVADERKAIYKMFSKELLSDFLKKLRESSVEILNEISDPLGYTTL